MFVDRKNVFPHSGGLHTERQLNAAINEIQAGSEERRAAFDALMIEAEKALGITSKPLEVFEVPGYYRDAAGHDAAKKRFSDDVWAAYSCAIAYRLLGEGAQVAYAEKSLEILSDWSEVNRGTGGDDGDLTMVYIGVGLILAAELMYGADVWSATTSQRFEQWVRCVYLEACNRIQRRANNWGDWGLLGSLVASYFLDEKAVFNSGIQQLREKIDHAVAADGHLPLEVKRGKNGLWYTYFALSPLTAACEIVRNASGVDLFHYKGPNGAGLEDALDYLIDFCREPEGWPHYQGADLRIPEPHGYPGNLFEAMAAVYDKPAYARWVESSRPIMRFDHHYTWSVPTLLPPFHVVAGSDL